MDFTFIDLFCGIGGFRQAMESVGGTCVFSSDKNKNAWLSYQANYGEIPSGNITKIQAEDIPPFNVLCAGFPCQPFSIAGKQRGFDDKRGTMFFEIARIVDYHKPEVIFLENVANLEKHDNGNTIKVITGTLDKLGYDVEYKVLNSKDYGVAQIRKRIYIICFRKDLRAKFSFPEPFESDIAVEDFLEMEVDEHYYIDRPDIVFYKEDSTVRVRDTYRMGYIGNIGQGRRIYSIKGLTPTFVVSARGPAGGTESYYINGRVRRLTPNECKRIMGFPENFVFPVPETRAYEQLGNSVAVPVLKAIARQIVATNIFEDTQDGPGQTL
jgi:DNA (cytosine-5)-methyltransferase 1